MAWIESHESLGNHPKLLRLTLELQISKAEAVGHLHYLWWWAINYAKNGQIGHFDDLDIAAAAQWFKEPKTLRQALLNCSWIDPNGKLHDWEHFAGACMMAKARQKKYRERRLALRYGDDVTHTVEAMTTLPNHTLPNHTLPNKEKKSTPRFAQPTPQEVTEYSKSINFVLDGQQFCDFYESKGWKVGNTPMKSWQAAVRTWKKRGGGVLGQAKSKVGLTGGYQPTKQPII